MTVYTLFGQQATGTSLAADPSVYTLSMQFSVTQTVTLDAIWFYSPAGAAVLPQQVGLFTVSGQSLVFSQNVPSWSGAAGAGWVRAALTTPVTLTAGVAYQASVFQNTPADWYSATPSYWSSGAGASGITTGPLTAPGNAGASVGQDSYNPAGTISYPSTTFNSPNYWIDVEVDTSQAAAGHAIRARLAAAAPQSQQLQRPGLINALVAAPKITVVQSQYIASGTSGNYASNITAGNSVFVVITTYSTSNVTMSTSAVTVAGQSLTELAQVQSGYSGSQTQYVSLWGAANSPGGSSSVSATVTNGTFNAGDGLAIYEVSGLGSSWALDKWSTGSATSGTAMSSGATGVISAPAEFILGGITTQNQVIGTPAGLTTTIKIGGLAYNWGADAISSSAASYTLTGTQDSSGTWAAAVAAIKPGAQYVSSYSTGRISASLGAPVQNPQSGPVFIQKPYPVKAAQPLPPRGRIASSPGAPAGIKWRVGSGASADSGGGTAASQAITIPSTVQAGDVCLVAVEAAINTAYSLSVSSTGTTPAQLGTDATYTVGGYITILRLYWFAAAGTLGNISTDAGKVITFTPTVSAYLGASIGAWWGCSASQPDVISSPATLTTANTSFTAPSATTGSPGVWAVYIAGIGGASSDGFAAPGTFRTGGTNARTNIADSNGSVGAPGTVIGGVTWRNAGSAATWAGFTVGLQPTGSNPQAGPVFRQKTTPVQAKLTTPARGRTYSTRVPAVKAVPSSGPPVYPLEGPVRARLPLPCRGVCRAIRFYSLTGNPQQGPVFTPKTAPVQAWVPLPRRGRVYTSVIPKVTAPSPGPVFFQANQALRAKLPQQPLLRGRISSNAGAPVRNPQSGPVFVPKNFPVKAAQPFPLRGRVYGISRGAPLQNPQSGPVFTQKTSPARIRPQLPPRGRNWSNRGIVGNPVVSLGPPVYPLHSPVRIHPSLPPRGRIAFNKGAPVHNPQAGPVFVQAVRPIQVRIPQVFSKGRVYGNPGGPVLNPVVPPPVYPLKSPVRIHPQLPPRGRIISGRGGPVLNPVVPPPVYPLHFPVQAKFPLPPRGRVYSNPGTLPPPVVVPAKIYPLHGPVQARRPLPLRGRVILGNKGAAVSNPQPGPVFRQAVRPIRAVIPQNAPRGRVSGNPGGPVQNIPQATLVFRYGDPHYEWSYGDPASRWSYGDPQN